MAPLPTYAQSRKLLATPLTAVRGVGPRLQEKFHQLNLHTVEQVLFTLPFRYEDRRQLRAIACLHNETRETFFGEVISAGEQLTSRNRKKLYEVVVSDGSGRIALKWFHYRKAWLEKQYPVGRRGVFTGEVKQFGALREIHHPEAEFLAAGQSLAQYMAADPLSFGRILPVYPLTEGLTQKNARKIWKQIVDQFANLAVSPLPADLTRRHHLLPLDRALQEIHFPPNEADLDLLNDGHSAARKSLVFDEFFYLELGMALKQRGVLLEQGHAFQVSHLYTRPLAAMLPFRLTAAQRRVLGEIKQDMMAPHPMNRLLQGDVGSGKTVVALMAALVAIENDTQVAVVAPTEILAEQHYRQFQPWMDRLGLKVLFLTGSITAASRRQVLAALADGTVHMVVGTHAVLQEDVVFARLGLGIIDEQHRFGVLQRAALRKKGRHPDLLVMTATPIPRTLALTVYGDLALSVIDELPPGRTPVATRILPEKQRQQAYVRIREEVAAGRQAYII